MSKVQQNNINMPTKTATLFSQSVGLLELQSVILVSNVEHKYYHALVTTLIHNFAIILVVSGPC